MHGAGSCHRRMDEASRSSLNIVIVTVARRFSVFRVLERDAFVDDARGVPFFTSDSIRPVRPRASHGLEPHSVGCPLCDFGGDATGSDETTRARAVSFGDAGEKGKKTKKQKKPLANASLRRASRRLRQTHLGLFFQPDVAVLEQPVEVVRAHGFRFPLVRVVHEVLHAAHRRDSAHDDGEGREGLERLRLVSGDDGATERDGAEGRREVSAARGRVSGSSGDARGRARANEDARFPAPGRRRSVCPAAVEGFVVQSRRGVPCAVLFRLARRGGGVGARSDASVRLRGSGACERRDHRSASDVRLDARLGMARGVTEKTRTGKQSSPREIIASHSQTRTSANPARSV